MDYTPSCVVAASDQVQISFVLSVCIRIYLIKYKDRRKLNEKNTASRFSLLLLPTVEQEP